MHLMPLLAFASAFSVAIAVPTPPEETHPSRIFKRKECRPDDFYLIGSCNGTYCRRGGSDYLCVYGTCVGPDGGNGTCCGWDKENTNIVRCPNGGW